jgi:hypothetical protein
MKQVNKLYSLAQKSTPVLPMPLLRKQSDVSGNLIDATPKLWCIQQENN